jgi:hypothetical protein
VNTLTADEPPRPHPAIETAFLAPEVVLWDARNHRVHHFNRSASAVWLCVDGHMTADQIATELSEIFETSREVIRPDVDDALAEFLRLGLLDGDAGPKGDVAPTEAEDHRHHHHDHGTSHRDDPTGRTPDGEGIVVLARPPDP